MFSGKELIAECKHSRRIKSASYDLLIDAGIKSNSLSRTHLIFQAIIRLITTELRPEEKGLIQDLMFYNIWMVKNK